MGFFIYLIVQYHYFYVGIGLASPIFGNQILTTNNYNPIRIKNNNNNNNSNKNIDFSIYGGVIIIEIG